MLYRLSVQFFFSFQSPVAFFRSIKMYQHEFSAAVDLGVADLVSSLYAFVDIPRKRVQDILELITKFLSSSPYQVLFKDLLNRLTMLNEHQTWLIEFKNVFDKVLNPFVNFATEYLRINYFIKQGTLLYPRDVTIGGREEYVGESNAETLQLTRVPCKVALIPPWRESKAFTQQKTQATVFTIKTTVFRIITFCLCISKKCINIYNYYRLFNFSKN